MIWQRTRGLQNMLLICQLALAAVVLCVVMFLMGVEKLNFTHYPIYALVVMAGLLLEQMNRERARVRMNLWQHTFLDQHRVTVRQIMYAAGGLLAYLVVTKDQFISRWF